MMKAVPMLMHRKYGGKIEKDLIRLQQDVLESPLVYPVLRPNSLVAKNRYGTHGRLAFMNYPKHGLGTYGL